MRPRTVKLSLLVMAIAVLGVIAVAWIHHNSWAPTEQSLIPVLTDIDRIRVRTGGTCHSIPSEERQLFEEKDISKIQVIIQSIHIDTPAFGTILSCNCCGNPSIEFYRGEELIVTLGCQHGQRLRWIEGWNGDGPLTTESTKWLKTWMAMRGVDFEHPPRPGKSETAPPPRRVK